MLALLDADIVAFRCAASAENEPEEIAVLRTDKLVRDILYLTGSTEYELFLTGANNFRKQIYPEYKANRKDKPKPVHLQACRNYLIEEWNAQVTEGCEADDQLGMYQTDNSCICSIDKDLLQIPGKHYNFVKYEWYNVTEFSGLKHFYEQLLMGDKTDNIPGVAGLGKVKAAALLDGCTTEQEMLQVCRDKYNNDELLEVYGKCLWIWRKGTVWSMQKVLSSTGQSHSDSEEETKSKSTTGLETEQSLSLEPTEMTTTGFPVHGL